MLSGAILEKVIQSVLPKFRGCKWLCLTTHGPLRRHSDPQQNLGVDQMTPPSPWEEQMGGADTEGVKICWVLGHDHIQISFNCEVPIQTLLKMRRSMDLQQTTL